MRELRQAHGREARPLRSVPRLHRISRVQDDQKDHCHETGTHGGEAGPDSRREVPEMRIEPRRQTGALWRVHRVYELSYVQVRQAEVHGRPLPEGRRRYRRTQIAAREGVLRLRQLS